jgi:O-acetylhomoserine/O-acetylserine sulfhydrylase-like pyridoxal-dependent enzyme
MSKDKARWDGVRTKVVHASREFNSTRPISSPIWQTTAPSAESSEHFAELLGTVRPTEYYSRYGNPTHEQVEVTVAALEGGEAALLTGSRMGAIFTAVMSLVQRGDHVIAPRNLYAGTTKLLEPASRARTGTLKRAERLHLEA